MRSNDYTISSYAITLSIGTYVQKLGASQVEGSG